MRLCDKDFNSKRSVADIRPGATGSAKIYNLNTSTISTKYTSDATREDRSPKMAALGQYNTSVLYVESSINIGTASKVTLEKWLI